MCPVCSAFPRLCADQITAERSGRKQQDCHGGCSWFDLITHKSDPLLGWFLFRGCWFVLVFFFTCCYCWLVFYVMSRYSSITVYLFLYLIYQWLVLTCCSKRLLSFLQGCFVFVFSFYLLYSRGCSGSDEWASALATLKSQLKLLVFFGCLLNINVCHSCMAEGVWLHSFMNTGVVMPHACKL